jgi:hypothetical protein
VPSYEELLAKRDRMLGENPATTFILCHLSNEGVPSRRWERCSAASRISTWTFSARGYEIGRQPRAAAWLFGTDMDREHHMYEGWWRLLETADEYIPGRVWRLYYGLKLPADVLEPCTAEMR